MPYRRSFPYLDEVNEMARKTVLSIVHRTASLKGYNTDELVSFIFTSCLLRKTMVLLGAGGAALAIITQAIHLGVNVSKSCERKDWSIIVPLFTVGKMPF